MLPKPIVLKTMPSKSENIQNELKGSLWGRLSNLMVSGKSTNK